MTSPAQMQQWMSRPETLDRESLYELRALLARYPYYQLAWLLYLKCLYLLHDASFGTELRRAVPYVADRRMLFYLIEGDRYDLRPLRQQAVQALVADGEPGVDRTLSLIDSFLASTPDSPSGPSAQAASLASDYTAYLLTLDDAPLDDDEDAQAPVDAPPADEATEGQRRQSLIDDFLHQGQQPEEGKPSTASTVAPTTPTAPIAPTAPTAPADPAAPDAATLEESGQIDPSPAPTPSADTSADAPSSQTDLTPRSASQSASSSEKSPEIPAQSPTGPSETDGASLDEGLFTETLARIYVKQHRYEKALEIIKKLNEQIGLNNPKKSAYFADQIRFLEKLIINEKAK